MSTQVKVLNFKKYGITINGNMAYIKVLAESEPMPIKTTRIECRTNKNETIYQYYERLIYASVRKAKNTKAIIDDSNKLKTLCKYNLNLMRLTKTAEKAICTIESINGVMPDPYIATDKSVDRFCSKLQLALSDLNRFNIEYIKAENAYAQHTEVRTKYISKNLLDVLSTAKLSRFGYTSNGITILKKDIETLLNNCNDV